MPIGSRISLIMGQIEPERPELFALSELLNTTLFTLYHLQILTNQHQSWSNVCDHKISNEFDHGSNRTKTVRVNCPWIRKFATFDFVYTLASANIDQSVPNLATIYLPIRSSMSSIMVQIKAEHPELFALEFGKIAESNLVYTLASTNINQWAPNLVKMYVTIRSRMSLIMDLIGPELSWGICPWICKNCWLWLCLHSRIYKCRPMSTKHGHNIYYTEILDEFNYGSNPTVTSGVICPWIRKIVEFDLVYTLASTNNNQHQTWS